MKPAAALWLALLAVLPLAGCHERATPVISGPGTPATAGIRFSPDGPEIPGYTPGGRIPMATPGNWWQSPYIIDSYSRLDEILTARVVRRGAVTSAWRRSAAEPDLRYTAPSRFGGGQKTLDEYLARNPVTGLLVAVGDTIAIERYQYGRRDTARFTSFSMAKTIAALAVGLALQDGAIRSVDDPAERYVPALAGREYGRTPIRHLLTMSSGVRFREDYDGNDDIARLSRALANGPGGADAVLPFNDRIAPAGSRWYYASVETEVLGLVLKGALKRPIAEYLSERLWEPLGAEADASWVIDRSGQELTFGYFNAVLRDYARLGLLLADHGRVHGRQIIPEAWLQDMTRAHFTGAQTGRWFGYGFQTWVFPDNDGSFALLGVHGQSIFIDPSRRLVMVQTAVRPTSRDPRSAETYALWQALRRHYPRQPA